MSTEIAALLYGTGFMITFVTLCIAARRDWWNGELTNDGAFSTGVMVTTGSAVWPLVALVLGLIALGKALTP